MAWTIRQSVVVVPLVVRTGDRDGLERAYGDIFVGLKFQRETRENRANTRAERRRSFRSAVVVGLRPLVPRPRGARRRAKRSALWAPGDPSTVFALSTASGGTSVASVPSTIADDRRSACRVRDHNRRPSFFREQRAPRLRRTPWPRVFPSRRKTVLVSVAKTCAGAHWVAVCARVYLRGRRRGVCVRAVKIVRRRPGAAASRVSGSPFADVPVVGHLQRWVP